MNALTRTNRTFRSAALLLLGALAVHWLRYLGAYGHEAGAELHRQGHGYLVDLLPSLIALAMALLAAAAVIRIVRPFSERRSGPGLAQRTWFAYSLALFAIFAAQEASEGLLAPGHAGGIDAVLAGGGWLSIPLSALFGALVAASELLLARTETVLAEFVGRVSAAPPKAETSGLWSVSAAPDAHAPALGLLAFGFSRRPPPAAVRG